MRFKDRLVLTDRSWGIRSVDVVFDWLFSAGLLGIVGWILSENFRILGLPFFLLLFVSIGYFILLNKWNRTPYPPTIWMEFCLAFLFLPAAWLNGYLVFCLATSSWGLVFLGKKYITWSPPFAVLFLVANALVYNFFPGWETTMDDPWNHSSKIPNSILLPGWGESSPGEVSGMGSLWSSLSWLGFFPFALAVFRKFSVFIPGVLFFVWVYLANDGLVDDLRITTAMNLSGLFFAVYLLPSRNHYSLFLASVVGLGVMFILLTGASLFSDKSNFIIGGIFLYFVVEAMFSKIFYGMGRDKAQG